MNDCISLNLNSHISHDLFEEGRHLFNFNEIRLKNIKLFPFIVEVTI